jgi:hypothetical protein
VGVVGAGSGLFGREGRPFVEDLVARPNIARIYDALLGGKDNLAVDREIASRVVEAQPLVVAGVHANRAFLRRAVGFLAARGVDQFLDIGCGLPVGENVHEVAGRVNPRARTVYVDIDPIVLVHARARLAVNDLTIVVEGDVRDAAGILGHRDVRGHLDFARPVAVVMCAILHFVEQDPAAMVRAFAEVMAPGSALVVTHVVEDGDSGTDAATRKGAEIYSQNAAPIVVRTRAEVAAWFDGFTLVPPGMVYADTWRRAGNGRARAPMLAGVGLVEGHRAAGASQRAQSRAHPAAERAP